MKINKKQPKMHSITFPLPGLDKLVKGPKTYRVGVKTSTLISLVVMTIVAMRARFAYKSID